MKAAAVPSAVPPVTFLVDASCHSNRHRSPSSSPSTCKVARSPMLSLSTAICYRRHSVADDTPFRMSRSAHAGRKPILLLGQHLPHFS